MSIIVPNQPPTRPAARRVAIIGEAPGEHELTAGRPFVGPSGQLLNSFLAHAGLDREACFVGNVCQHRPPGNNIALFKWDGPEVQAGLAQLTADLTLYQPHLCILLGNTALRAFSGERRTISDWRGYVWRATHVAPGAKCIGMWHPAAILRDMGLQGEERFYMGRAVEEARTDDLHVPARHVEWNLPKGEIIERLRAIRANRTPVAADIEGGCGQGPACHGFADSPHHALVVPIYGVDGASWWSEEDEVELMEEVAAVWEDPLVPKIIQNAPYEMFVLAWTLGIVVHGLRDDTMLKHFELYAELDKALEFQAVVYTRQPYWKLHHRFVKAEGRYVPFKGVGTGAPRATSEEWFIYNGTDCMVTYECSVAQDRQLKPMQRQHYEWGVSCLAPTTYASLRGLPYNEALARERLTECLHKLYEVQDQINQEAARSPARASLRAFYNALRIPIVCSVDKGVDGGSPVEPQQAGMGADDAHLDPKQHEALGLALPAHGSGSPEAGLQCGGAPPRVGVDALLPLLTTAFCQARRTEAREVEEVTWQPHRWNGKRWVRAGRRLATAEGFQAACTIEGDNEPPPPTEPESYWLKPHRKLVTRNIPVEVETLEDVRHFAKDTKRDACKRAICILREADLSSGAAFAGGSLGPAQRGELATLLGIHVKINATGRDPSGPNHDEGGGHIGEERDANWFIYEHCGAPRQYTKEAGRLTTRLTTNDSALITVWLATQDPRIRLFMEWRSLDTRREALEAECDPDGRIRCSYILPGTETCRLACRRSPTNSGYNLQTVTEELRDLFPADPECWLGQLDLRGADGWTVAAECARLGDDTMLLDLVAGIKPANVIALIYKHGPSINQLTREELLVKQGEVAKDDWTYIASKKVLYGGCYLMGEVKMSETLREDSYKETGTPVYVAPRKCREIQEQALFLRYPGIRRWQEEAGRRLVADGQLTTSLGFTRRFFGRKKDATKVGGVWVEKPNRQTLGEWLGHAPQYYTTAATKLALMRLWNDPTNRLGLEEWPPLKVEPLHTVHDSLNPQWPKVWHGYAVVKLGQEWFNNPLLIGGQELVIPASGTYGESWGQQGYTL